MKVERARAAKGIFKATYSALTNVHAFKYTCESTEFTSITHEFTETGRKSDDTTCLQQPVHIFKAYNPGIYPLPT